MHDVPSTTASQRSATTTGQGGQARYIRHQHRVHRHDRQGCSNWRGPGTSALEDLRVLHQMLSGARGSGESVISMMQNVEYNPSNTYSTTQDGPVSSCPFTPTPISAQPHGYHMLGGSGMPMKLNAPVSLGVDPHMYDPSSASPHGGGKGESKKKKGCCVCASISVACRVEVMVRRCESDIGCPVTYCVETRFASSLSRHFLRASRRETLTLMNLQGILLQALATSQPRLCG